MLYDIAIFLILPILAVIISSLILKLINNEKGTKLKELYLPLLNSFSESLFDLRQKVCSNYMYSFNQQNFSKLLEDSKNKHEYINLPEAIKNKMNKIYSQLSDYRNSLNSYLSIINDFQPKHILPRGNQNIKDAYILDFTTTSFNNCELKLNFPLSNAGGGFTQLYCDTETCKKIWNSAQTLNEHIEYINIKESLINLIDELTSEIKKLQKI